LIQKTAELRRFLIWSGIVEDVRTYWQTVPERFFIPSLSLEEALTNGRC